MEDPFAWYEEMAEAENEIRFYAFGMVEPARKLWHRGDGCGGLVTNYILDEFDKAGLNPQVTEIDINKSITAHAKANRLRYQVLERDAYRCQHCGDWHSLQIDHIYPASKGGKTELDNLQVLCATCNAKKGARI